MGHLKTFKWQRGLPIADATHQPPFGRYNLKPVKQLPTQIFTATATGAPERLIEVYVPANSWALNKNLIIRGFYVMTVPAALGPPFLTIGEDIVTSQSAAVPLLVSAPFAAPAGTYTTLIERDLVRIDPNIWACDQGDVMQFNWANRYDMQSHMIPISASVPPFDYTVQIQVAIELTIPVTIPGLTIQCLWAEAFLEQAVNLGTLP